MYRVCFFGADKRTYLRFKTTLPDDIEPRIAVTEERLRFILSDMTIHGLVCFLNDSQLEDLFLLRRVLSLPRVPNIIVVANYLSVAQTVSCIKVGIFDCLTEPVSGPMLGTCLHKMMEETVKPTLDKSGYNLVGESEAAADLKNELACYAATDYPVLITGETGSGKELAAKIIHSLSSRKSGPFNALNCSSYSDDLLSSELFGSSKGAFTGSVERPGFFEVCRDGTLFLDEIGDLSPRGQATLLRVLDEKTIRRLGSVRSIPVNTRVIAATNCDLRYLAKKNRFRSDLYHRLNVLGIHISPLRKRKQDIPALVRYFLAEVDPKRILTIDSSALSVLFRYNWPGNVRELRSVLIKTALKAPRRVIYEEDLQMTW